MTEHLILRNAQGEQHRFSDTCLIEDCGRPRRTLGYCNIHYQRFHRHGDPLAGGPPVSGGRVCRTCKRLRERARWKAQRA